MTPPISRRQFIASSAALAVTALAEGCTTSLVKGNAEPIIDIHQHTNYSNRPDLELISHQRAMGITFTILLPAGLLHGLAANCTGNQDCYELARARPKEFAFCANEVADLPGARQEIEKYLKLGAVGIAEQKFHVDCDSKAIWMIAEIAREYDVPVLLHFQHDAYNLKFERFPRTLEKFPGVKFIGHAQTWWGNIDAKHDQKVMYPKGPVTPGGLTDRWLGDHPNLYGDLSAGSGLNALNRDPDFTRGFLARHQDKLMYGSDCNDSVGHGSACQGAQTIATIRRFAPNKAIERKLLYGNAKQVFGV